jgi:hypothetical protein
VDKGIQSFRANGQWQSYDLSEVISGPQSESYAIPVDKIARNGFQLFQMD